jgi:hypothetical protein
MENGAMPVGYCTLQKQLLGMSVLAVLPQRLNSSPWYDARLVQLGWNVTFEFRVHHEKQ